MYSKSLWHSDEEAIKLASSKNRYFRKEQEVFGRYFLQMPVNFLKTLQLFSQLLYNFISLSCKILIFYSK